MAWTFHKTPEISPQLNQQLQRLQAELSRMQATIDALRAGQFAGPAAVGGDLSVEGGTEMQALELWGDLVTPGRITRNVHPLVTIAAGGSATYTVTMPTDSHGGMAEVTMIGLWDEAGSMSVRRTLHCFYLHEDGLLANTKLTLAQTGSGAANIDSTVTAVGSGNQMRLTIANANAATAWTGRLILDVILRNGDTPPALT